MNVSKMKYCRTRIENLFASKKKKIRESLTTLAVHLDAHEMVKLIRSGKVKLLKESKINYDSYGNDLRNYFDFSEYESVGTFQKKEYEAKVAKLEAKYTECMDQIMLGEDSEALKLIDSFISECSKDN